jgi:hypothetical protein
MDPQTPENPIPVNPAPAAMLPAVPAPARPRGRRAFKMLLSAAALLATVGACAAAYVHATHYGQKVVEAHLVDARIEIANPPAYLDRGIVHMLLQEAYQFAQKDEETFNRSRNTLDGEILGAYADLYTGTQMLDGKPVKRQAVGFNAWMENVTQVRRVVARDKSVQSIQIFARWREPAAWVRVGDNLYLIDASGTRLPGEYRVSDRGANKLMVVTGVDLPTADGKPAVPAPGEGWRTGAGGTMGEDLAAGMQLAGQLTRQPFAAQIAAIDVTNLGGRRDSMAPWIVLDTVWQTASGRSPRVVWWGRPTGQERYYEVNGEAKIKTLNELYRRFSRIDAGRDYVDIRTEVVWLPKLAMGG